MLSIFILFLNQTKQNPVVPNFTEHNLNLMKK